MDSKEDKTLERKSLSLLHSLQQPYIEKHHHLLHPYQVKKEPIRRREKFSFKKSIVGTGNFRSCQWPIGDPLEEGFHYCGGQNIPTKPYCIEHFKKAYNVDEKYLDRLLDFLHEKN